MSSLAPPNCLHIPPLQNGGTYEIYWDHTPGQEYQLECVYDGDFSMWTPSLTWNGLKTCRITWQDALERKAKWLISEGNPVGYTVYQGQGILSKEMEEGISHTGCTIRIPWTVQGAQFRIRAIVGNQYSPYATSEIIGVEPNPNSMIIKGAVDLTLETDKEYHVQVNMRDLPDFADSVMTLCYPADRLSLLDSFLEQLGFKDDFEEHTYCNCIEEVSREPGTFRFRCTRPIPENTDLTGLVACFRFTATADGDAAVILQ